MRSNGACLFSRLLAGSELVPFARTSKQRFVVCVRVRAAHPHENVPGAVGVASNPSPIALSKGASLSSADPFSHGRQIERSSDPHRGQGLGVSLNDSPHRPDPFDSCLGARLPTGIPSTGNSLASSSLRKVLLWEVPPCNFNGSR